MLHVSATHEQEERATVFALCRALFVTFSRIEKVKIMIAPPPRAGIACGTPLLYKAKEYREPFKTRGT